MGRSRRSYKRFKFKAQGKKDKTTTGWWLKQFHLDNVGEEGPVLCKVHAKTKVAPSPAMGNEAAVENTVVPEGEAAALRRTLQAAAKEAMDAALVTMMVLD